MDAVVGVVSDTDLIGLERSAPFTFLRALDRAETTDDVVARMSELPAVVIPLVEMETDPVDIGHVIASAIDATTRRLIHVAIAELGDPPGPWAWLALGSEARHEQSLVTDQDHALVFGAPMCLRTRPTRTSNGWRDASPTGWPRPGSLDAVAVSWPSPPRGERIGRRGCRRSANSWRCPTSEGRRSRTSRSTTAGWPADSISKRRSISWCGRRRPRDGSSGSWRHRLWTSGPRRASSVRFLVGWDGSRAGTLDVKHGGITPITNLARTFAVASGVASNRTIDRLRAASSLGALDPDLAVGLEEAFRLLWRIRLRHQVRQLRAGDPADDQVDPRLLGPLTRRSLREAFKLITAGQRLLSTTYGLRPR